VQGLEGMLTGFLLGHALLFFFLLVLILRQYPADRLVSYEFLRFSGAHSERPWARLLTYPGLMLQRLTTRLPDRSQIEVAVAAMNTTLVADGIIDADPRLVETQNGPLRTESAGDSPDADASTD